ncbi:hypothetical protein DMENIID0001_145160 [Sergentomyia squamirostris]
MVKSAFLSAIFNVLLVECATNWCQMEQEYCQGREHIACEPNSFPSDPNARDIEMIPMTKEIKKLIVDTHNRYRSMVAAGKVSGIPSAAKMEKMSWNDSLAFVASKHAKHANFEHDQCRSFAQFPFSGQNLAIIYSSVPIRDIQATLREHIELFFNEVELIQDGKTSCIDFFTTYNPSCLEAGHFTAMVKDINNTVGCSLARFRTYYSDRLLYTLLTTCNYGHTNLISHPIYTTGQPCSACKSIGKSCEVTTKLCI